MEKISIKKELYFEKYEFLKFYVFFWILFDFYQGFLLTKSRKKRDFITYRCWRGDATADVARGTQHGLRRGTEATWQRPGGPRKRRTGRAQPSGREAGHVGTPVGRHVHVR